MTVTTEVFEDVSNVSFVIVKTIELDDGTKLTEHMELPIGAAGDAAGTILQKIGRERQGDES